MSFFSRKKPKGSSALSVFIRNASSGERKRVYTSVIKKAIERQKTIIGAKISRVPDRIDISDPNEVRSWAKSLGVSEDDIRRAVAQARDQRSGQEPAQDGPARH
jgi:uncharacterized protein DUF3606